MDTNEQLEILLADGEKRGFLSYDDILFALTDSNLPEEEISKFYETMQDKGITIVDDVTDDEDESDFFWSSDLLPQIELEAEFAPKDELAAIMAEKLVLNDPAAFLSTQDDKITPLKLYLEDIAEIAILSIDEENALFTKAIHGDQEALSTLIHYSQSLVMTIAAEFSGKGVAFLDLVQEANMGLFDVVAKYDADFAYRPQAIWWMRYRLRQYVREEENIMRIPANIAEDIKKLQKKEHHLQHHLGRVPFDDELAKELEWDTEQVSEVRQLIKHPDLLEELLAEADGSEPIEVAEENPESDDYWQDIDDEEKETDLFSSMQKRSEKRANAPKHRPHHN